MKDKIQIWTFLGMVLLLACTNTQKSRPGSNQPSTDLSNDTTTGTDITTEKDTSRMWSILAKGTQSAMNNAGQRLVKTQAEFDKLWAEAFKNFDMPPQKPRVNFDQDWVIAAFLGEMLRGGHEIYIRDIQTRENVITIQIVHSTPGPTCLTTMSVEYPYLFARIKHFPQEKVEFKEVMEERTCN